MKSPFEIVYSGSEQYFATLVEAARIAGIEAQRLPNGGFDQILDRTECIAVVIDASFPDVDVDDVLAKLRSYPICPLPLLLLENASLSNVSNLMRAGVYHCASASATALEWADILESAKYEAESRRAVPEQNAHWRDTLVGNSPLMEDLCRIIALVAPRRCTVLITGETGTGKEVAARAIHMASDRCSMPFVALNCSAIPEHLLEAELFGHTRGAFTGATGLRIGRFEQAHNGTLFLDEIGDMPLDLQAKLLRALQEREVQRLGSSENIKVNVRVIAATNVDLRERVREGRFREDLFYRLNVVPMEIPPLRERQEDVLLLARHFVRKICRLERIVPKELYKETLRHLAGYAWPGNVRELENMVEKAVVMSGDREDLCPSDFVHPDARVRAPMGFSVEGLEMPDTGIDFPALMANFERNILGQALQKAKGNKTLAADLLRLKRTTLISKIQTLAIQ